MEKVLTKKNQKISFFDKDLITIFLISKILITSIILFLFYFYADESFYNKVNRIYFSNLDSIFVPFSNWDGNHYLMLSDSGYANSPNSWAFFPLYPLAISFVNFFLGNVYLSAFLVNSIFTYLFTYVFYNYCRHHLPKKAAIGALILFFCFPTSFYLTVFYSEALFLFLLYGFLYYYEVEKSYKSLVFIFLLPLCRGQAIFVLAGLLIVLVIKWVQYEEINVKYEKLNLAAFFMGTVAYFLFYYFKTGSAFSAIEAQKRFVFNNSISNLFNVSNFFDNLFSSTRGWFNYTKSMTDRIFIWASLLIIPLVFKTKKSMWIILYLVLCCPLISMGSGGSFVRFSLIFAPIISIAILKYLKKRSILVYMVSAVFFSIQILFTYRFSLFLWVA
jgi:Gpi18-like mannosyltransferase